MPRRKPKDPDRSADFPHNWVERQINRLSGFAYYNPIDLSPWEYRRTRLVGPGDYQDVDSAWREIHLGEKWGGPDITVHFRKMVAIPESHSGTDVYLEIFLDGGEAQLSINGRPWQGLDWNRCLIPLGEYAVAGKTLEIEIEAFVINYPYDARRNDDREFHTFERARLVKRDPVIEKFIHDAQFVLDAYLDYHQKDDNLEMEGFLLHHLTAASQLLGSQHQNREVARKAAQRGSDYLEEMVFSNQAYLKPGRQTICPHSHLDLVYLWPIKETLRKNCRTITNMLSLMREYPDFQFSYSQPYLYENLKEMYPGVYDEVRQQIKERRWEPVGAMYIEPDGNLPGGESMIRQILFGKRFLKDEFGIDAQICWLPDVFGVMYTLPQILVKSGVRYFSTVKLNIWNDTNVFPHDTFRWRGPDGSEVITHFPPTHFGQSLTHENLRKQWRDYREKNTVGENLFIYGWADGGGGPTREMVEAGIRAQSFPGLPENSVGFAEDFFNQLDEKAEILPVWDDELYLETHRGTYTTKGDLKHQNRKAELLYRDAEILSSIAGMFGGPYQQDELNKGWKLVLLNQFHDTLTGSHRPEGVPDIKKDYETAFEIGASVRDDAAGLIAKRVKSASPDKDVLFFNTLSWTRPGFGSVELQPSAASIVSAENEFTHVQHYQGRTWFCLEGIPPMGWMTGTFSDDGVETENTVTLFDGQVIESDKYLLRIGDAGAFSSIYDKGNNREVLEGSGNEFQVFEDDPGTKFGAWDIAYHFEKFRYPVTLTDPWKLVTNGPLFAVLSASWQVLDSVIEQEMWLFKHQPRIDFKTRVDWQNSKKLLKVAFPVKIRTRTATYDLPFGNIERPTHRNTSWDQAKYEVCAHHWADLSEGDYGVALLNDSKYGYDTRENVLRLSLVRSPVRPSPKSDLGVHEFTYSLYPHKGNWRQGDVDRQGNQLNVPAILVDLNDGMPSPVGEHLPETWSLLKIDAPGVIVETLKQAENGDGIVLRTYENQGNHLQEIVEFFMPLGSVVETNLIEEDLGKVDLDEQKKLALEFSPYEIKTHRLAIDRP
jgi:alpha-mannosidase